jgi:hypothetical protein
VHGAGPRGRTGLTALARGVADGRGLGSAGHG